MRLIGFNGTMGVGKSTAIECLKDELPANTRMKLVKFAQPLYDMQESIYRRIQTVHERPEDFTKDRKLLQWLGTDWGRDTISKTLWVDIWKAEVIKTRYLYPDTVVVCDDVRFDNEAEMLKSLGGVIVKITSGHAEKRIDTKSGISNHASEAGINPSFIDCEVENNGTRLEFLNKMTEVYKKYSILLYNTRSN